MNRYFILDFIRIVAMILVIASHIGQEIEKPIGNFFGIHNFYWVSMGGVAVTLFLIISGAVLQLQYGTSRIDIARFFYKRVLRIYPLYLLVLVFSTLLLLVKRFFVAGTLSLPEVDSLGLICSITGFCAFVGKWGGPFLATAWFIGLIVSLYLIFPLLSRWVYRFPHRSLLLLLIVSVLSRIVVGYHILPNRALDWFPLCRVFEFGLGIYGAVLFPRVLSGSGPVNAVNTIVAVIGKYSFSLFLVHYPMLFVLNMSIKFGLNLTSAVVVYLISIIVMSIIFFHTEIRLQKRIRNIYR